VEENAAWCPGPCLGDSMASHRASSKRGLPPIGWDTLPWVERCSGDAEKGDAWTRLAAWSGCLGPEIAAVPRYPPPASASPWPPPAGGKAFPGLASKRSASPALSIFQMDRLAGLICWDGVAAAPAPACHHPGRRQLISASLRGHFNVADLGLDVGRWQRGAF